MGVEAVHLGDRPAVSGQASVGKRLDLTVRLPDQNKFLIIKEPGNRARPPGAATGGGSSQEGRIEDVSVCLLP
jgi:hypothetical protein